MVDRSGNVWEEEKRIVRKIKRVRKLEERWRWAIPLLSSYQWGDNEIRENKEITYQLMDAFITQERFNIIDTRDLPILIDEKNLHDFIEHPYLGPKEKSRIWIDVFLLGYVHQSRDSVNMFASLVDLETGEILATKDVFEKMDPTVFSPQILQEHMANNCYALANKFKEHFPLREGRVISLNRDEVIASICKSDGLKRGMKLIIFEDLHPQAAYPLGGDHRKLGEKHQKLGEKHQKLGEDHLKLGKDHLKLGKDHLKLGKDHLKGADYEILGEVKVKEVSGGHSIGLPLRGLESYDYYDYKDISKDPNDIPINLGAITR